MWFCSVKDGCGRRLKLDVNKIQSRTENVIMKEFITVTSITKAGECAMKPSGSKQTGDNRLLHSLLTACCSYAILGHSMSWGPEVLRASETGFERSYMKDDLRFNSHKYTYHGLRCLSYTNPWKRSMKSCRMSFWAFHANLFLPDTHYWPVSSTVHCARGHFWSTIIFFMFLAVLL